MRTSVNWYFYSILFLAVHVWGVFRDFDQMTQSTFLVLALIALGVSAILRALEKREDSQ